MSEEKVTLTIDLSAWRAVLDRVAARMARMAAFGDLSDEQQVAALRAVKHDAPDGE